MSTTAQIAAKGCQATGLTDELADRLHDQLGRRIMAIVELEASARTENADGDQKVQLRITMLEPAVDDKGIGEDHLRELARALAMNRRLHSEQAQLAIDTQGDLEPTVEQVITANPGLLPHDYTSGAVANECDVCGNDPFDPLHTFEDDPTAT